MRALVFDLDDTLYKELDYVHGAFAEVAGYLAGKYRVDRSELYQCMIKLLSEEGRGRIFNELCKMYKFNEDIGKLVEIYRSSAPDISLYEDAEHFLEVSGSKYKLGLITDGIYYVQRNKIKLLGIEKYFDSIIVTDELGKACWKPSTVPYLRMAEALGVSPDNMVYIGDNPYKDFFGAKQLGIYTIRVIRAYGDYTDLRLGCDYEADVTIKDMYELERVIEILA
jgi:putative hydrolase of the HAD superfamily